MTHPLRQTALFLILLGTLATAQAADDPVLIESANVKITRSDYEAELQRLPDDLRGAFSTSKPRIEKLLQSMLVNRTLAEDARKEGLDKDPQTQRLLALQLEKFLAELRVERLMRAWNAEFDKNEAVNLKHAQELYVADKEKFRVPEQVNVSHILVKTDHRSKEEALKLAKEIRAKVVAPHTDFAKLAEELSEDKSAKTNHGDLGFFVANQMDSAFSDASFAMKKKGEISQPVLSQFGYHIIRYQDRKPSFVRSFDEAKDAIMADMRQKYIQDKRTEKFNALVSDSSIKLNEPAIETLKLRVPAATGAVTGEAAKSPAAR